MGFSMNGRITSLIGSLLAVVVGFALMPLILDQIASVTTAVQYSNGDTVLDYVGGTAPTGETIVTGTSGTTQLVTLTCGSGTVSLRCGSDKFPILSPILSIFPILVYSAMLVLAGGFGVVKSFGGLSNFDAKGTLTPIISGVIVLVVGLLLLPIGYEFIEDSIIKALQTEQTTGLAILRLAPILMLVGLFGLVGGIAGGGTAIGYLANRGKGDNQNMPQGNNMM